MGYTPISNITHDHIGRGIIKKNRRSCNMRLSIQPVTEKIIEYIKSFVNIYHHIEGLVQTS